MLPVFTKSKETHVRDGLTRVQLVSHYQFLLVELMSTACLATPELTAIIAALEYLIDFGPWVIGQVPVKYR